MQILFGYEMNKDNSLSVLESQLSRSIDKTVTLYLSMLYYLNEVCQYMSLHVVDFNHWNAKC